MPPYRFGYLIERARHAAQTVQAFGGALLTALEKKDVEELTLLRSVHEQELLRMTKDIRRRQLEEAQLTLQSVVEAKTNVENRIAHYQGLVEEGRLLWEWAQQGLHAASILNRIGEAGLHMGAAVAHLVPQVGSPFAMKFGGMEVGASLSSFAGFNGTMAGILDAGANMAGTEASFQRWKDDWRHQLTLAQQELKQVEQQRLAAAVRVAISEQELEIHDATMENARAIDEFYRDKFTRLGLYDYLATTMSRVYRAAYNAASDVATMAQRAYAFERDETATFVEPDNWKFDKAGLLAGERLTLQLQQMENAFLHDNERTYEITQAVSMSLVSPAALIDLRAKGTCEFTVPEVLFDLAYPGQFKRLIKSVRVSIPAVAGPYQNVSAKLTLVESKVRKVATLDPGDLVTLPVQTTPSIATSTAQGDSGLFELSFRDERYLPFEGAGAVSTWRLELPAVLRAFDYDSISDVILHISYTALDDGALRDTVEAQIVDELTEVASTTGLERAFSLRHDFPDAFHLLMHPAGATQTTDIDLGPQHFPYFLSTLDITASGAAIFLQSRTADPVDTTGLKLKIGGTTASTWSTPPGTTLRTAPATLSGPLHKSWTIQVTGGALEPADVADIFLLVKYGPA